MTSDCIFCKIAAHEVKAGIVYEDEDLVAFHDIHPKYLVHLLIIPKQHVASSSELGPEHDAVAGKLLRIGAALAEKQGIAASGFRLVANTGPNAGQAVDHLHIHLFGGSPLRPL